MFLLIFFWFSVTPSVISDDVHLSELILTSVSSLNQTQFCQEYNCKEPATLPITVFAAVQLASPLYVSVLPLNSKTKHIDNVCYTFFDLGGTALLVYQSVVYKDGYSEQFSHIEVDVPGRLGVLRGGSPGCSYQEYAFELACQGTFLLYRCFLFGSCQQFDAVRTFGVDTLFALSAEPKTTEACQEEHVTLLSHSEFFDKGYVKLPQSLPYKCVTSLNGAPCLNAEKVPPTDSIAKP